MEQAAAWAAEKAEAKLNKVQCVFAAEKLLEVKCRPEKMCTDQRTSIC